MPTPKGDAALINDSISALAVSKRGPLLNAKEGRLGGTAKDRKNSSVFCEIERVISPISLCYPSSITLQ